MKSSAFGRGCCRIQFLRDRQTQTNLAAPVVQGQPDCFGRGGGEENSSCVPVESRLREVLLVQKRLLVEGRLVVQESLLVEARLLVQ